MKADSTIVGMKQNVNPISCFGYFVVHSIINVDCVLIFKDVCLAEPFL